jgi:tetratricopeptide (TPR) repeat protein
VRLGDVVADRFELEQLASEGGMGAVWRARDRVTGERVAVKVVLDARQSERLAAEAALLEELEHPNVVRHVGHGRTTDGSAFLAMEWLEGEDLSVRLKRGPLSVREALELGANVARALGAMHTRGVVHRDVKPSNLFLPRHRIADVKLLDLGIARARGAARPITHPGMPIGTPGYMAPEQARGEADIDARADVFSLGCVLFECIAGTAAFSGEHLVAILAKILVQDAPRLSSVALVAPELDALVAKMLAKERSERPESALRCAEQIERLRERNSLPTPLALPLRFGARPLSEDELEIACVVLVGRGSSVDRTPTPADVERDLAVPLAEARAHDAHVEMLADGTVLAVVRNRGAAKDLTTRAARLALALHKNAPDRPAALATGRAAIAGKLPVGEAIDRASRIVRIDPPCLRVDEVTAGLLDARFDLASDARSAILTGQHESHDVRRLLGREVPCVGRQAELSMLEGLLDQCASESVARCVLVTAPAGLGKSRLLHELTVRLRERASSVRVWLGRGDPASSGSPLGILGDALRRLVGVQLGEPIEARRAKIRARAGGDRVAWFLGEILATPFDATESPQIAAARLDPQLMRDQTRRAFEDFVAAECVKAPVLLVLEDMHWGDAPTAAFVEAALRACSERPFMVVASARPEIHESLPSMWQASGVQELRLRELSRKAGERLVRGVLPSATDATVARLVDQSAGNALFLEELVRSEAEGRGGELPGSVLAMVHTRLETLRPDLRRILRAASVFGRAFWRGGVATLTGGSVTDEHLRVLVESEIVVRLEQSRFPSEQEWLFQHELVREAAYRMLTDEDRALGHKGAAEWLETAGETDPLILAEHFEKGGELERAALAYTRAARQALDASDFGAARTRAERGLAHAFAARTRAELCLARAQAVFWQSGDHAVLRELEGVLPDLPEHEPSWFETCALLVRGLVHTGAMEKGEAIAEAMLVAPNAPAAAIAQLDAASQLLQFGRLGLADALSERAAAAASGTTAWHHFLATRSSADGDPISALAHHLAALASSERTGDVRGACRSLLNASCMRVELGDFATAERDLRRVTIEASRLGLRMLVIGAEHMLGMAVARLGNLREGIAIERRAVEAFEAMGFARHEGGSRSYLALLLIDAGDLEEAEAQARRAVVLSSPPLRPLAHAVLSRALALRGDGEGAYEAAREASRAVDLGLPIEEGESLVRLVRIEALAAAGEHEAARTAAKAAREALLARAARIHDETMRRQFLEHVPENARTLADG